MAKSRALSRWRDSLTAAWNMLRMPGRSYRGPLPPPDDRLGQLAGELRQHVLVLAEEIGERNLCQRPAELARAADYIEGQLARAGYAVCRQWYAVGDAPCCNLEAVIPGSRQPEEIVIIGAHYDSVPGSPAANDNASGVAAVLSLARSFRQTVPRRTLRFVAFVNEELPYAHTREMGSWVYARHCRQQGQRVTAMLSLETIGCYRDAAGSQQYPSLLRYLYPSAGNYIAFVGNTRYARLVRTVAAAFRAAEPFPSQAGALPEFLSDIGRSDHWPFWQEGYPALMVTDTAPFRYPYYHTAEDTPDKLDFERTARVVRGLGHVVAALAGAEVAKVAKG